jgi:dihydroorotase
MNNGRYLLNTAYDMHVHLRRGDMLKTVLPYTARYFRAAIIMPNTDPPILTISDVEDYRDEILAACKHHNDFKPLMTIKLTPQTYTKDLAGAKIHGVVDGKFYPEGVTTNSQDGFCKLSDAHRLFEVMQDYDLPLSIHAEKPGADPLLAEQLFLEEVIEIAKKFPKLRVIVEHLSSKVAVETILSLPDNVVATITAHHLAITHTEAVANPHSYCKPVAKQESDRQALIQAATSGNPKFFFGSDSAPHPRKAKETDEPKAGCFTAPVALQLLAEIFEQAGTLTRLDDFVGKFGPAFYGIKPEPKCISLLPHPGRNLHAPTDPLPFLADKIFAWRIEPCRKA